MDKQRRDPAGAVVRSFEVALNRRPTLNELRAWEEEYKSGATLDSITAALIASSPFATANGELTDEEFIALIYQNSAGIEPSDERLAHWIDQFDQGAPRSDLTTYWADSFTVKNSTWHGLEAVSYTHLTLPTTPYV